MRKSKATFGIGCPTVLTSISTRTGTDYYVLTNEVCAAVEADHAKGAVVLAKRKGAPPTDGPHMFVRIEGLEPTKTYFARFTKTRDGNLSIMRLMTEGQFIDEFEEVKVNVTADKGGVATIPPHDDVLVGKNDLVRWALSIHGSHEDRLELSEEMMKAAGIEVLK